MQNAPGAGAAVNPPGPIGRTMGMMTPEDDLCVIGGGAAGLVVAAGGGRASIGGSDPSSLCAFADSH